MTAVPIWPGVTEYLYQAARFACVLRSGTCIVPSPLRPRRSRFDWTPIAGMATDTGGDWRSRGPFAAAGPIFPAADGAGAGACCCASTAMTMASAPKAIRETPVNPASLSLARPRGGDWGANALSAGHDMTTRNPAMRGELPMYAVPSLCLPQGLLLP